MIHYVSNSLRVALEILDDDVDDDDDVIAVFPLIFVGLRR
jgi:hypothetical protein